MLKSRQLRGFLAESHLTWQLDIKGFTK